MFPLFSSCSESLSPLLYSGCFMERVTDYLQLIDPGLDLILGYHACMEYPIEIKCYTRFSMVGILN